MSFRGMMGMLAIGAGFCMFGAQQQVALAQQLPTPQQLAGIAKDNSRHFGDDPDDDGPIATDLSYGSEPAAVGKAMRKVADWQLARSQP
jgi:unsaturated rhamnogalacturonyl hydrolase